MLVFPKIEINGDSATTGHRWTMYISKFKNLFVAMNINSRKRKKALLLHYAGEEVYEIYGTLHNTRDENGFDETKQDLTSYFKPKVNTEFEIFKFRQMKQLESETCNDFATRLQQKAKYCDIHDKGTKI